MYGTVPLSIIRSFSLYTQQWYMSYSLRAGSGRNSVLIPLTSCQQTCMTYTIAVCTVKNSWWWTEELSETCRVFSKNKFEKLLYLAGFITRIYYDARSPERQIHTIPSWSCSQAVRHIPLLCVQWKNPGDGQRNCPKHVEFYSKNKFEKLLYLAGFIIRIYHDARSPERQIHTVPTWSCSQAVSKPVWHIPLLCVQWKTADDGQRNCPKHVEIYSQK